MLKLPGNVKNLGKENYYQKGQALLIILLVLSVVLTVSLSIVSRSVTDIKITSNEEESVRALSAAEAGVEQALKTGVSTGGIVTLPDNSQFEALVTEIVPTNDEFAYPKKLNKGESITFWLVSHDDSGNLNCIVGEPCYTGNGIDFYWGEPGTADNLDTTPAIEVSIYYDSAQTGIVNQNFSKINIVRANFDPKSTRLSLNDFTQADIGSFTIGGKEFKFRGQVDFTFAETPIINSCRQARGCVLMAKVRMFYNDQPHSVGIDPQFTLNNHLSAQGINISSTGTSGLNQDITRKINVFQSFAAAPHVFDSTLFSYGDLIK
ncbi:hypothetical protein A2Z22_00190 [Candidatus Woesebacteria bacterium RBG_16_34_12]|uniref:Type 4 fimbrial biogenesis protein PilX N-terminal domain-containing protein n=1 Tax=Candidatus Woesebacteria bacterium RBG_16_34_12 TaxID=1802480 RepID=A0A1F7XAS6_9BACT|nr:MAG: hypothetical protein A2Z22_00190 [Candidatus Woesebacteria bacterium RBG_16_34_12]